jgi:hypothetical protein
MAFFDILFLSFPQVVVIKLGLLLTCHSAPLDQCMLASCQIHEQEFCGIGPKLQGLSTPPGPQGDTSFCSRVSSCAATAS